MNLLPLRKFLPAVLLPAFLLAGCTPAAPPNGLPTAASVIAPTAPVVTTEPEELSAGDFNEWAILQTARGIEALNPAAPQTGVALQNLPSGHAAVLFPAAKGGWLALLDGDNVFLSISHLPDGETSQKINLLSNVDLTDDMRYTYRQALASTAPLPAVWSPDGGRLAFLAAIDHSYLELYLYDTGGNHITRLTEDVTDLYQPVWSPDGQWILYDVTEGLNPIGLWAVTAVKAVRANGAETKTIYEPQSYAEPLLGWSSPSSYIVHSVQERGPVDLREVSLEDGQSKPIYAGVFDHPVYIPQENLAVFQVSGEFNEPAVQEPGIYNASTEKPPRLLANNIWNDLRWEDSASRLAASNDRGTVLIDPVSGETIVFAGETGLPLASPDGKTAAFAGGVDSARPGLRFYPVTGGQASEITADPVNNLHWLSDGRLVYASGEKLFLLPSPSEKAIKIEEKVTVLGWLEVDSTP